MLKFELHYSIQFDVCVTNILLSPKRKIQIKTKKTTTHWIDKIANNKIKVRVLKIKHLHYQMQLIFSKQK